MEIEVYQAAGIAFTRALQSVPALSRETLMGERAIDRGTTTRVESFVRERISPLLVATEVERVRQWGSFGGAGASPAGGSSFSSTPPQFDGEDSEVEARDLLQGVSAGRHTNSPM